MCQAYPKQYGFYAISLMLTSTCGTSDKFDNNLQCGS